MRRLSGYYRPQEVKLLAKALESSIMNCLFNITLQPEREEYWRNQADRLEQKFSNDFGRHYSYFLYQ